jgi:membrane-bound serine protease (ClpP class)
VALILGLAAIPGLNAETRALLVPLHEPVFAPQIDSVRTALETARKRNLGLVFLEIDIAEGEPIHGKEIGYALADATGLKVIAYIRQDGHAAGALIALAASEVVMRRGATLGNAGIPQADEKRLSPLRSALSSYARQRGYPRRLAEAMADPDLEVLEVKTPSGLRYCSTDDYRGLSEEQRKESVIQRTVVARGKILTLDAEEAVLTGFARKVVSGRGELYALYGLKEAEVEEFAAPAKASPPAGAPSTSPVGVTEAPVRAPGEKLPGKRVAIIPINDGGSMIDMPLAGFIRRQIEKAKQRKVDLIVFEVETWGGRLDSADRITDYIAGTELIPTVAYVQKAISAGAVVSIACKSVYMVEGSNIGSALPVDLAGKPGGRKVISTVRGKMKSLAEKNAYPYRLVEPMVDPDIELVECRVDGELRLLYREEVQQERERAERDRHHFEEARVVCGKGDILNLSAGDAQKYGLSKGTLKGYDDLWSVFGYEKPVLFRSEMNWPENLARFISSPYVCGVLMAIGGIALLIELVTPGFGLPGTIGLLCLGLALWSQYMVENANAMEILLFLIGFAMIAIELLALPGFGAIGVLGGVLVFVSLLLAYIPDASYFDSAFTEPGWADTLWRRPLLTFLIALGGVAAGVFVLRKSLSLSGMVRRLTVTSEVQTEVPGAPPADQRAGLIGKTGRTLSPLRPAGTAEIEGEIVDVMTDGEFLGADTAVRIVRIEGNRVFVKAPQG